ncbi:MAG TPA: hypothetical protein VJK04_03080 [Candidatus Paceibacterota bacterium]
MSIIDQIRKVLDKDALSHGYLFVGRDIQAIKNSLEQLLKKLENLADTSTHTTEPNGAPLIDTKFFSAGGGSAKGGEVNNNDSIGIDTVRRLKEFLWQKPIKSPKKTAVIVNGDTLTPEAQNALLKISEDPPPNSQIFIILKNEENLLPTLRSRFPKIYLTEDATSERNKNNIPEEVMHFAEQFLKSDKRERSEIIKSVTGKGTEVGGDKTLLFLDAIIFKLSQDPVRHASFLGAVLERKALISSLSLNRRLQLAYLSSLWYNKQY